MTATDARIREFKHQYGLDSSDSESDVKPEKKPKTKTKKKLKKKSENAPLKNGRKEKAEKD